jgi:hypothetical protein
MLDLTKVGTLRTYQQKLMGPLWLYQSLLESGTLPFMRGKIEGATAQDLESPSVADLMPEMVGER